MISTSDRFWSKVREDGDCWIWTAGRKPQGYGLFWDGTTRMAYRFAYEEMVGPVPDGLHLDHLCRTPACVNPYHLDPVPPGVNVRRGMVAEVTRARHAARTHCKRGHEFTAGNTYSYPTGRASRACALAKAAAQRAKRKAVV